MRALSIILFWFLIQRTCSSKIIFKALYIVWILKSSRKVEDFYFILIYFRYFSCEARHNNSKKYRLYSYLIAPKRFFWAKEQWHKKSTSIFYFCFWPFYCWYFPISEKTNILNLAVKTLWKKTQEVLEGTRPLIISKAARAITSDTNVKIKYVSVKRRKPKSLT